MKYLFLVSHGRFAEGLKTSLEMFSGDTNKRTFALCLHNGETADDFKSKVVEFLDNHEFKTDDEFVIIADIIGGSPLTTFMNVFLERGLLENSLILGGANFTMALTAAVSMDNMDLETLSQTALSEAKTAIQRYELPKPSSDDEDDI